jgi:hypothetical protein
MAPCVGGIEREALRPPSQAVLCNNTPLVFTRRIRRVKKQLGATLLWPQVMACQAANPQSGIVGQLARIIHEGYRSARMSAEILAFCRVTGSNPVGGG